MMPAQKIKHKCKDVTMFSCAVGIEKPYASYYCKLIS